MGSNPRAQFPAYVAGAEYTVGDYWTFTAYFIDTHNLNSSPEIQLGTVKPGVLKQARAPCPTRTITVRLPYDYRTILDGLAPVWGGRWASDP